jgi:hypothetical protein
MLDLPGFHKGIQSGEESSPDRLDLTALDRNNTLWFAFGGPSFSLVRLPGG